MHTFEVTLTSGCPDRSAVMNNNVQEQDAAKQVPVMPTLQVLWGSER